MNVNQFSSRRDEGACISYMLGKLRAKRSITSKKVNQIEAIDEAVEILEERQRIIKEEKEDAPDWSEDETSALIDHYVTGLSGVDSESGMRVDGGDDRPVDDWNPNSTFTWGEWRLEDAQPIKDSKGRALGYSDELVRTISPIGGGATIHAYSEAPPSVNWELTKIGQKGIEFLIGKAKISEIDAVCSVPSLPEEMSSEEAGKRVGDRGRGPDEWQRRVNAKRVLEISNFIGVPGNIIANSALLYAPPGHDSFSTDGEGGVSIDFSKFLRKRVIPNHGDAWLDHDFGEETPGDLRPLWLIDGQHRVRGLSQSEVGCEIDIPIILFTSDFSLGQSAKVFAEINTLQKKLDTLHTLYMQHRFQIPNRIFPTRDFSPWDSSDADTWDSRQNHLSYECAGWLASHEGGPLFGRIKILESNRPKFTIIKANSWVDYSRSWFGKNGPYSADDCEYDKETMFQEIENYFQAFVNTCNHGEWPDEEDRWSPHSKNKGVLQLHSSSQALLLIYQDVHEKARMGCVEEPISVNRFQEVLLPLKWADWRDERVLDRYSGSGEVPRTSLRVWMRAAVRWGKGFAQGMVMSANLKSQPGRGLLAPPADSPIEIDSDFEWPEKGKAGFVQLSSLRPHHSLATSRWSLRCSGGKNRIRRRVKADIGEPVGFRFSWDDWVDDVKHVIVRVEWVNVNSPEAHFELKLKNPNPP